MCQCFRAIWHKRWWRTGGRGVPRHFPRAAHTQKRPSRPSHSLIQFCVPFTHFPLPSPSASEKAPPPSHRLLLDPASQFFCRRHHHWMMKMSFASSSASSFSSNSYAAALMLVPALLLLQLVLVLPVAAAGPTSADRQQQQQQQKQQLQMEKRFYAWDEMSAKRSLIPPMSAEIEMDPLEGAGEGPAALVWKRSSSHSSSRLADQLKRAWRPQQQPLAPNRRLFFGPPRPMPMQMMMMV